MAPTKSTDRRRAAVLLALLMGVMHSVQAQQWEDYDNFNGLPDNSPPDKIKWKLVEDPVAGIFIHNEMLAIDFNVAQSGSVAVKLLDRPHTIRGLRMDVTYQGRCRHQEGLVASAIVGKKGGQKRALAFLALFAREKPQIQGAGFLLRPNGGPVPLFDPVAQKKDLMRKTVPVTMRWSRKRVRFRVANRFDVKRRIKIGLRKPRKADASVLIAAGRPIGIDKACRILIDNVEVRRTSGS